MTWQVGPTPRIDPVALAQTRAAAARADFAAALAPLRAQDAAQRPLDATPPPEALAMVEAAQHAIRHLHEQGRELHFDVQDGDVRIEVRDLDGNVLARVPPGRALDILTGGQPWEDPA
jgi:hypothetical protein